MKMTQTFFSNNNEQINCYILYDRFSGNHDLKKFTKQLKTGLENSAKKINILSKEACPGDRESEIFQSNCRSIKNAKYILFVATNNPPSHLFSTEYKLALKAQLSGDTKILPIPYNNSFEIKLPEELQNTNLKFMHYDNLEELSSKILDFINIPLDERTLEQPESAEEKDKKVKNLVNEIEAMLNTSFKH
ncbi:MAG: hypothetical protein ACD_46C00221G0009 [uncultured bacterium]|nr:MAG: hypothetical protein ACD_46C00221G0009 [uncultured bacterium]